MAEYRTAGGRVLTDADIDRFVDEAERGYDVDQLVARQSFPLLRTSKINRRARQYRKMVYRRGWLWAKNWLFLEPAAVKPSKRGRRG